MTFNLDNVVPILRARGLTVVEVAGWINRGYAGQDLAACYGAMWHHTATNRAAFFGNNMPTLGLLTDGRSDLPGPLCNFGLGRDGTVYVVATGVANHAGSGSWPGIPTNQGNHYTVGVEMESSGIAPWDWTPEQIAAAPKLGAALALAYAECQLQIGHMEYSDAGKIDPAGWPGGMDGLRKSINAQIAAWTTGKPNKEEGQFMNLPYEEQVEIRDNLRKLVGLAVDTRADVTAIKGRTDRYLDTKISDVAQKVVDKPFPKLGKNSQGKPFVDGKGNPIMTSVALELGYQDANFIGTNTNVNAKK